MRSPALVISMGPAKPMKGAPMGADDGMGSEEGEPVEGDEQQECECPKCGHAGPMEEFAPSSEGSMPKASPEVEREARRLLAKQMGR